LKLCTFEIHTHLGQHRRLGAVTDSGIIDLNFACAARLAAQGEVQPQKLADVFLPGDMRAFLEAGPGAIFWKPGPAP